MMLTPPRGETSSSSVAAHCLPLVDGTGDICLVGPLIHYVKRFHFDLIDFSCGLSRLVSCKTLTVVVEGHDPTSFHQRFSSRSEM